MKVRIEISVEMTDELQNVLLLAVDNAITLLTDRDLAGGNEAPLMDSRNVKVGTVKIVPEERP